MNWAFYIIIALCVMLSVVVIATFASLVPKDNAQNTKLLTLITVFSFAASIVGYGLAMYQFSTNPTYMMHFLLAFTMLILLPACLISAGVSTVTISNLRDTLAAAK
jgi:hypothetical protein